MTLPYAVEFVAEKYPSLGANVILERLRYSTFVSVSGRYMYFEVPKAACTTIKTLLHKLENFPPVRLFAAPYRETRRDMFIHARANVPMPSLIDLPEALQEEVLTSRDFFRFTVVRNPFNRLLSGWKNKIYYCEPGFEGIYFQLKGGLPSSDPAGLISLDEFVRYLSAGYDLSEGDHHWRRQSDHLFYQAMKFSYVGRTEAMNKFFSRFQDHLGLGNLPEIGVQNKSSDGRQGIEAFATSETLETVRRLYKVDFDAFDYSQDPPTPRHVKGSDRQDGDSVSLALELVERNRMIAELYGERERLMAELRNEKDSIVRQRETGLPEEIEPIGQLTFDRYFDSWLKEIKGWGTRAELKHFYSLALEVRQGAIVEIGSYHGRSTCALALGASHGGDARVFAVEPHEAFVGLFGGEFGPEDRGQFFRTMMASGFYRQVRLVNLRSDEVSAGWTSPVELLLIDGDHRYDAVRQDLACWHNHLKSGAKIVLCAASDAKTGPGLLARELEERGLYKITDTVGNTLTLEKGLDGIRVGR